MEALLLPEPVDTVERLRAGIVLLHADRAECLETGLLP